MKIYTKTGDKGETSLVNGKRVSKNSLRVEAYGTSDEANSMIGFAISFLTPVKDSYPIFINDLEEIQTKLFYIGSELSTPVGTKVPWPIKEQDVFDLEVKIDRLDGELTPLKSFILPGGSQVGSVLHVARTFVRRLERLVVSLYREEKINEVVIQYLNRLSDYLFVAARWINQELGQVEKGLTIK